MATISQREAHRLRKRVAELEAAIERWKIGEMRQLQCQCAKSTCLARRGAKLASGRQSGTTPRRACVPMNAPCSIEQRVIKGNNHEG